MTEFKQKLSEEYRYRTELHAHTKPVSPCSEIEPEEMVKIYSEKGYDAIAITNHFMAGFYDGMTKEEAIAYYLSGYEQTKAAAQKYGLTVLLGTEIRFTESANDYLIYGVDEDVLSAGYDYFTKGVEAFRTEVSLDRSVFVQAHPFRDGQTRCNPKLLDGVEAFNFHPGHNGRIGIAARFAKENGLQIRTAGSDFHHKNQGHEAVCALRTKILPKDSFALAEILKSGDYLFEIGEDSLLIP